MRRYIDYSLLKIAQGLIFTLAFSSVTLAQFSFERSNHIPVLKAGDPLDMPWSGGLNYVQLSEIDMDFDGRIDLFVFDRSDDQVRVFLSKNDGTKDYYEEAPQYRFAFPSDLRYRAALVDYNLDGMPDIFTYAVGGVKVYKNVGNVSTGHQWELVENLLYSNYYGNLGNLYVSSSDLPAYVDVDGDGDIDILTFHIGGERLEYHKNMSMENYGVPDSLEFVLMNECWGNFREDESTNSIILISDVFPCGDAGGNIPNPEIGLGDTLIFTDDTRANRHAGSTILAIDYTGSGVMDLILGDISFPNLVLLTNGGTIPNTNSDIISVDYNFPSNTTPSNLSLFPAGFYVDADHDGVKDLVVCPNAKIVSENQRSIWRYKNLGTTENPNFVFQENDFLQNQMIDAGSSSVPILVDVNGDGLKDLIVTNFYSYKPNLDKDSRFLYYQNTGTASNPVYTFVDEDKFSMSTSGFGLRIIPAFGDLDGDGDMDMIVGAENGRVHYFNNTAGVGNSMSFGAPQYNLADASGNPIAVGSYSSPFLVDLNRDGLLDLVVGNKNGRLSYYQNTGTSSVFEFTLVTANLGAVDVAPSSPDGYAVPHFVEVDAEWHLFVGARDGKMHYYTGIEDNLQEGDSFTYVSNNFAQLNFKGYSAFWIEDVTNNGHLELFAGSDLGGIELFEADPNSSVGFTVAPDKKLDLKLYPNPAENMLVIEGLTPNSEIVFYDFQGRQILSLLASQEIEIVDVAFLTKGFYFVMVSDGNMKFTGRFVKK